MIYLRPPRRCHLSLPHQQAGMQRGLTDHSKSELCWSMASLAVSARCARQVCTDTGWVVEGLVLRAAPSELTRMWLQRGSM